MEQQESKNYSKIAWKEAATGGLYLGLAIVAVSLLSYLLRNNIELSWITGLLNVVAIVVCCRLYGRRMSSYYFPEAYTFIQSLGFLLRMMLFAGVMAGLGQFVIQTYLDPQYYQQLLIETVDGLGMESEQGTLVQESWEAMQSPLMMLFSGVFSMLVYGGLISMVVSIFIKRPALPQPKIENEQGDESRQEWGESAQK